MIKILIAVGLLLLLSTTPASAKYECLDYALAQPTIDMDNLITFLATDQTDQVTYNPGPVDRYDCGYFSSDLATNASKYNIKLGTIILEPDYGDYHVMNYVYINDSLVIIEPQSDRLYSPFEVGHNGFTAGMLIPYRTYPITWVLGFEADITLIIY